MSPWRDCKKDPPELGKKVLCCDGGDLFVAMRFEEYYCPFPFVDHYHAKDLCFPQIWCEISFPDHLTGYIRIGSQEDPSLLMTMDEFKEYSPEDYKEFAERIIANVGTQKNPHKKRDSR